MSRPAIRPAPWQPPPAPELAGVYAPNDRLTHVERWEVPGRGPEDVAADAEGNVYTGLRDGRVLRLRPGGHAAEQVADTGGRPLGIEVLPGAGALAVCDAHRGLLRIDLDSGEVDVLVDRVDGRPLLLTNNATVAADGAIFFSESSRRFRLADTTADLYEHSSSGRVLRWRDGTVEVVADRLAYPNGVTLAPDGASLLVAEMGAYAIQRIWLDGPRAGRREAFATNLPGFPDNLSTGGDGTVWVALPTTRMPGLDRVLALPPLLRRAAWRLPRALQPSPDRVAFVLGFTPDGQIRHNLQGAGTTYHYVTGVRAHDGWLYLGSVREDAVARVPLPA